MVLLTFLARVIYEHNFDFLTIIDCFTISLLLCQPPTEEAINRPPQRQWPVNDTKMGLVRFAFGRPTESSCSGWWWSSNVHKLTNAWGLENTSSYNTEHFKRREDLSWMKKRVNYAVEELRLLFSCWTTYLCESTKWTSKPQLSLWSTKLYSGWMFVIQTGCPSKV